MKKLLPYICILTAIACQPAQAREYYREYEPVGHNQAGYARVPEKSSQSMRYRGLGYEEPQSYKQVEYTNSLADDSFRPQLYIGTDLGFSSLRLSDEDLNHDIKRSNFNLTGSFGVRINSYFGVEAFYTKSDESSKKYTERDAGETLSLTAKVSYEGFGVDLLGYVPIEQNLDFLFGVGLASYDFEGNVSAKATSNSSSQSARERGKITTTSEALRLGIGLQYQLTDHVAFRAMGSYVHLFDDDEVKRMLEGSLGLRFMF